jgi:hypothetical protein
MGIAWSRSYRLLYNAMVSKKEKGKRINRNLEE